jgi:hypothetical protein
MFSRLDSAQCRPLSAAKRGAGLKHQKEKRSMDYFAGLDVSVDGWQPVGNHRGEDVDHLPIAVSGVVVGEGSAPR